MGSIIVAIFANNLPQPVFFNLYYAQGILNPNEISSIIILIL